MEEGKEEDVKGEVSRRERYLQDGDVEIRRRRRKMKRGR